MVLNGWNVIYRVKFDGDNQNLQDDFDYKDEAIEYAKSHLEEKPVVLGIEVYVDEFGGITDEETPEVLYSYAEEEVEEEIPEPSPDRLSELEAELHEEKEETSKTEESGVEVSEPSEVAVAVAAEEPVVEVPEDDPYNFVGDIKIDETPCVDPFACDFSDVSEDEAMYSDVVDGTLDPTVFLQELADELGIGDEVVIKPAEEVEIPEVAKVELVDNHYEECPEGEGTDKTFDCDFCDFEEPKTELVISAEVPADVAAKLADETPVRVELPVEAETAAVSEEPVATEAPCEGENCDPHCVVEEPAKEISDCHVCPTCGKEICECGAKLEESQSQEIGQTYRLINKYYGCDIEELVYGPEGFMKTVYPNGFEDFKGDIIFSQKHWEEFENWLKETKGINLEEVRASKEGTTLESLGEPTKTNPDDWKTDLLDSEADREEETEVGMETVIDEALEHFAEAAEPTEIEDPNSVEKALSEFVDSLDESASTEELTEDSEMEKHKAIADRFRASLEVEESLEEASSAEKKAFKHGGQDQVDLEQGKAIARIHDPKARDAAVAAVKAGRPEVAQAFIGDRKLSQAEQPLATKMQKMQDAGMTDESLEGTVDVDLSDDRTPVEETSEPEMTEPLDGNEIRKFEAGIEEEMSDLELAERLEAAKKEKHSKK